MTLMQLLTIVLLVALALWAVEAFLVVPLRQRRALAALAAGSGPQPAALRGLLEESPLARLLANVVGGCLLAQFAVVILMREDVDFSLVLVVATFLTGLFWLLYVAILRRWRRALLAALNSRGDAPAAAPETAATEAEAEPETGVAEAQPALAEFSASFFPVLALVLLVRSFLLEPFTIPSGSMLPTLEVGDYIVVNKYAYGLRLPVLGTEIVPVGKPQRGDVMVFRYPENPSQNFIKRVIGLPGDTVRVADGHVYVNGTELPRAPAEFPGDSWELYYREQTGAAEHLIRHEEGRESSSPQGEWTVPPASYFMMGDNRDNSRDSRYWGFVPDHLIVGRASYVWMHKEPGLHLPSFSRDGKVQ